MPHIKSTVPTAIRYGGEKHVNKMEDRKNVDAKSQDVRQAANMALIEVDKG